ncbi:MAG: glycosyltransferase [Planctomycetes bacterium]|nr:glycosyltransferase [Planctomycetota bacterium]
MRVALATPNFPPEFLGGTERVVLALARALRELGDEVAVVTGSDRPHRGRDVERETWDGFSVLRLPRHPDEVYGLDLRRPRLQRVVDALLGEQRTDVLHVHHWALLTTGLLRGARQAGIAGVATLHDVWSTCPRFFRRPPDGVTCPPADGRDECVGCVLQALPHLGEVGARDGIAQRDAELRAELAAARALTVPSAACGDRIRRHLPWDAPLEIVPHGLLEPVGVAERTATGGAAGTPLRIGTFGNLVEEKGVMLLVWACRGIPGIELHLYGPFLEARFAELVHAKAAEFGVALTCHGPYSSSEGPHPARGLDLAVFPSLCEETYGLVVEEALARGTPVVVSDRGALAERIGAGGVVVPVDELGPLANALRGLATDRGRLDALRRGVPTTFRTIADAAARYHALYRRVTEEAS